MDETMIRIISECSKFVENDNKSRYGWLVIRSKLRKLHTFNHSNGWYVYVHIRICHYD